jgi:hypothetical protein
MWSPGFKPRDAKSMTAGSCVPDLFQCEANAPTGNSTADADVDVTHSASAKTIDRLTATPRGGDRIRTMGRRLRECGRIMNIPPSDPFAAPEPSAEALRKGTRGGSAWPYLWLVIGVAVVTAGIVRRNKRIAFPPVAIWMFYRMRCTAETSLHAGLFRRLSTIRRA